VVALLVLFDAVFEHTSTSRCSRASSFKMIRKAQAPPVLLSNKTSQDGEQRLKCETVFAKQIYELSVPALQRHISAFIDHRRSLYVALSSENLSRIWRGNVCFRKWWPKCYGLIRSARLTPSIEEFYLISFPDRRPETLCPVVTLSPGASNKVVLL
jgi:hypothetical protein